MTPFVVGLVVALVVTGLAIPVLTRRGVWDVANDRSSHTGRVPRGGGIGVLAGVVAGALVAPVERTTVVVLCWCAAMALLGLADDLAGLGIRPRLALQAVAAAVTAYVLTDLVDAGAAIGLALLGAVWLVAYLNMFNFMDGINAISSLSGTVAGLWYAWLGQDLGSDPLLVLGLAVAGASLGFLPWNAPRARVFLGDVGSYTLGAAVGALALIAWLDSAGPVQALAPLTVYVADTGWALVHRLRRGEQIGAAHREHVYQRVVDAGWSHVPAALLVAGCAALVAVAAALLTAPVAATVGAVVLLGYLMLPRLLSRSGSAA